MSASEQCRMCGEMTESGVSLLETANRHIAQCIVSKFKYMITSNSRFPRYICNECAEELQDWMYFVERCKKAQTHFSTVVAAEKLENEDTPIKQDPDGPSQVTVCPPEDPLLSASELEIAAKFPDLKVASVPVVKLDQTDIERYQQPERSLPNNEKKCEDMKHSDKIHKKKNYFCHLCEMKCSRIDNFKQHLTRTHHISKEEFLKYVPEFYECKYCHRQFKTPASLHQHEGTHTLPFKCDVCGKRFGHVDYLKTHKLTHSEPQLQCPHCDKKFRQINHLKEHVKRKHSRGVRKYRCGQCEWKSKSKLDLAKHIQVVHNLPSEKSWKCDECGKCFKFKRYLRMHKLNVHSGSRYSCIHCGVKFKQSGHLKSHIETQHSGGIRKYKCDHCVKIFKSKHNLRIHTKYVHAITSEKSWKCDECGKCFKVEQYLRDHKKNIHSGSRYPCNHCGVKFKQLGHLKGHIETQHSGGVHKYKCDQCDKKFKSKGTLICHVKYVHAVASEKSWKCDECGKCFKFKQYLKIHKLNVHSGFRYPCNHCGVKFKQLSHLKGHIETQHSGGVRKYKCDQCEKIFKSKDNLRMHIKRIHSVASEKSWKCDVCGKCFKLKEYLSKHKLRVHCELKYCCFHCDEKFKNRAYLKYHLKTQHNGGVL